MSLKKLLMTAIMLSGLLVFANQPSKTVEAEGIGETIEKAMKNARENAIRKAFGEVVDSVTETKNEELIESTISASAGFLKEYKVISKNKQNDAWTVKIRAIVAVERLKAHIARFKKSSTNVDIKSQMKVANDAATQEKNAMKLAQWWMREIYNTIQFSDVKIETEKGELLLKWTVKQDEKKVENLAEEMARMLSMNGYKRVIFKNLSGMYYGEFMGSVFATKRIPGQGFECYNNPNVCLFWGDRNNNHPQNFHANIEISHIEIVAQKKDNSKTPLVKIKYDYNKELGLMSKYGDEESEHCSLLFQLFYDPTLSSRNTHVDPDNPIDGSYYTKISSDSIKDAVSLQVNVIFTAENGKGNSETVTLTTFPLANAGQLTSNAEVQKESLAKRSQDLSNIIVKYLRDIYKCIDVKASYKYNRFKKSGELEVELSTNLREYAKWNRNFTSSLESLNINIDETRWSIFPSDKKKEGYVLLWVHRRWLANIPDHDLAVVTKTREQLKQYHYYVEIQFKDASGEVLQRVKLKLSSAYDERGGAFRCGGFSNADNRWGRNYIVSGIDWGEYGNEPYKSVKDSFAIDFDVPEDAQKVSTVECAIIERIEQ